MLGKGEHVLGVRIPEHHLLTCSKLAARPRLVCLPLQTLDSGHDYVCSPWDPSDSTVLKCL